MKNLLIIVSGFSCSGKTTLAKKIAEHYSLPLMSRDDIKESLYDSLGYSDREWSKKLGVTSYSLLYLFTEQLLANQKSLIIESNFQSETDAVKLLNFKNKYQFNLLQIHCHTQAAIVLQRFENRAISGARHPGHVDHLIYEEMESNYQQGDYKILNVCDFTLNIDTNDFDLIDYEKIYITIETI